jgi:hypothetical protein
MTQTFPHVAADVVDEDLLLFFFKHRCTTFIQHYRIYIHVRCHGTLRHPHLYISIVCLHPSNTSYDHLVDS